MKPAIGVMIATCQRNKWCTRINRHRGRCSPKSNERSLQTIKSAINRVHGKAALAPYWGGRVDVVYPHDPPALIGTDGTTEFVTIALQLGLQRSETLLKRVREAARELTA